MQAKDLGKAVILIGALGLMGCTEIEKPYTPIPFSEVAKDKGKRVALEGIPSLITNNGFILRSNGENRIYVWRNSKGGLFKTYKDYSPAKSALEKASQNSEKIEVYGVLEARGNKTIDADYVMINGTLYPIFD